VDVLGAEAAEDSAVPVAARRLKRRARRFLAVDRVLDRLFGGPSRLAPQLLEQVEVVEGSHGDLAVG
jgi:hypothetical protein